MPIFLINILIGVAIQAAVGLLQSIFAKPAPKPTTTVAGIRATETVGGDEPLSFILGTYGTAGHREYSGTWGTDGDTPNAYYTLIRSVSDLPVRGIAGMFIDGARVTIGDTHAANGYPIIEYRRSGTDYLWIEFFDGTQTVADAFMVAKFGSDPDRPWSTDMIGRGIAYARLTARYSRDLFNGLPDPFFEIEGISVTDPRGDDVQDNPVVHIHQILSGISYGGEWVWGLQALPATRLPSDVWEAQMDKCDVATDLAAGGTEPRFRAGAEVTVDQQPIDVITQLLEACNGRIAEIGGIYKLLVAEPADPVVSFTDEDRIITEGMTLDPFPGLESTYNGITSSYIEPAEKWSTKQAPELRNTDLEAADDDRRLPAEVSNPYVYSVTQRQRLDSALLLEDRRFRTHTLTLPPEWWEYEVLDTAQWTSAYNGYTEKVFLITSMDDLPGCNQFVGIKEQDPADYDWSSDDEQPQDVTPVVIARPAPQVMDGWTASPATFFDFDDNARRPSIEITFVAGLVDVRAVWVQVRLAGETSLVFSGELPYDPASVSNSAVLNAVLLGSTDYEVRGKYVPYSGRETLWSNQDVDGTEGAWLGVTTPDIPDASITTTDILNLAHDQLAQLAQIRSLIEQFKQMGTLIEAADRDNFTQRNALSRSISVQLGDLEASFSEIIEVALGPGGAIATALESLYAAMGGNTSEVNVRWQAVAARDGYSARYAIQAAVNDGTFRSATLFLDVPADPDQPTRIGFMAGQTVFFTGDGTPLALIGDDGIFRSANDVVQLDMIGGAFSITVP